MNKPLETVEVLPAPICNSCGSCCRSFPFVKVTQQDVDKLESFTGLAPEKFSNIDELDSEKLFMKFNDSGDCVFLKVIEGTYACGVYEGRPNICRAYPANDVENMGCRVSSNRQVIVNMSGRSIQ